MDLLDTPVLTPILETGLSPFLDNPSSVYHAAVQDDESVPVLLDMAEVPPEPLPLPPQQAGQLDSLSPTLDQVRSFPDSSATPANCSDSVTAKANPGIEIVAPSPKTQLPALSHESQCEQWCHVIKFTLSTSHRMSGTCLLNTDARSQHGCVSPNPQPMPTTGGVLCRPSSGPTSSPLSEPDGVSGSAEVGSSEIELCTVQSAPSSTASSLEAVQEELTSPASEPCPQMRRVHTRELVQSEEEEGEEEGKENTFEIYPLVRCPSRVPAR